MKKQRSKIQLPKIQILKNQIFKEQIFKKQISINVTIMKLFFCITFISVVIALLLFFITFFGVTAIASDGGNLYPHNSRGMLAEVSEHLFLQEPGDSLTPPQFSLKDGLSLPEEYWCILIDENGDVIWSLRQPADIPSHYSLNDIARMTKWYLEDYPVYVRTEDYGLLVLGKPKNSVGKYDIEYSMDWFASLPRRILLVLFFNFIMASLFSCLFGSFLYRKIKLLTRGLSSLRHEEVVSLPARGIFRELFLDINRTSSILARKNALLSARDRARSNWVSGISHDIRTPLSLVVGYGEQLAENRELSVENRRYASVIADQGLKIKKLIEDLNLISSLEYDMQPLNKKPIQLFALLRSIVSDLLNQGLSDCYEINLELPIGQAIVLADEMLLTRAFTNLLQNSIVHNEQGCHIRLAGSLQPDSVLITAADDGQGCPEKILQHLDVFPGTTHGLGLPMAYKIIQAHGGSFHAQNKNGFIVSIELPLAESC